MDDFTSAREPPKTLHSEGRETWLALPTRPPIVPGRKAKFFVLVVSVLTTAALHLKVLSWWSRTLGNSTLPAILVANPEFDWYALEPSKDIQWAPCYSDQKCARLLLPLDYDTPDGPTTAIALRLIPAANRQKHKGAILVNPGGPGGSGTSFLDRAGQLILDVVGDSFDILGFDPRGVGASTPLASCFETGSQRALWYLQDNHRLLNLTNGGVQLERARNVLLGTRCEERIGGEWGIGRFMSTPNVARDMLEISQKLGQEKLLYWGLSYGTVLGQYFSAMYPDKVGRIIIDGVFDALNYRDSLWTNNLVDTDAIMDSFFHFCHEAGPERCGVYDSAPSKIRERYMDVLHGVEQEPLPVPLAEPPLVLTHKMLVAQMFRAGYSPLVGFRLVADTMRAIETNNQTALVALAPRIVPPTECKCTDAQTPWLMDAEAYIAVACGDGNEHPYDPDAYAKYFEGLSRMSPLFAPMWAVHYLRCAGWKVRPKWRWTGPVAANTSHPLLIVSTKYDPVGPLADAKAVHERFGGSSGLLVQNSYGHCSFSGPSLCTAKHIRAYLESGTLPDPGTVCEVEELPFIGRVNDATAMSAGDVRLLKALQGLAEVVPMFGPV
ncbi:alpha/beta-hydrolase [Cubamyces sp. BRFM 1775]|nr:alpha/beta-hydrolase [Cubamyces sp. BRFM 1775]